MKQVLRSILDTVASILAFGMVLASFSELWFYQTPTDDGPIVLIIVYGLIGTFFLQVMHRYQVRGLAGFFVSAGLFGFAIEGIPVTVLYEALPFTIAWTSLAWHALLSAGLGYLVFRRVMSGQNWRTMIALNLGLGLGLGIWGGYIWNATEIPNSSDVLFVWTGPAIFMKQFLLGYALFIGGHVVLDWQATHRQPAHSVTFAILGLILLGFYSFGSLLEVFPYSILLPALVGISLFALNKGQNAPENDWLKNLVSHRIPAQNYGASLALPLGAYFGYLLIFLPKVEFEANVLIVLTCVPLSVSLWLISLFKLMRAGKS